MQYDALFDWTVNPAMDALHIKNQVGTIIGGIDKNGTPFGTSMGSNQQVLFNDNGSISGSASLLFNKTLSELSLSGPLVMDGVRIDSNWGSAFTLNLVTNIADGTVQYGFTSTSAVNDGGAYTTLGALSAQVIAASSSTLTNGYALDLGVPLKLSGASITNTAGLHIQSGAGVGTHNYGILIDSFGSGANDYAIKSLGGKVDLGLPTADPGVPGALWVDTTAAYVVKQSH